MKKIILLIVIVVINNYLLAQDIHFSNLSFNSFYTSVASIGSSNAKLRATTHYRNQWPTVGKSFQTIGLNADYKMKVGDGNALGIGLILNRDQAGELSLTKLQADFAIAYHQRISKNSHLSGGMQLGIIQHIIDETEGEWGNQYNGKEFDSNLPSGEQPLFAPFMNFDIGAGLMWQYDISERNRFSQTFTKLNFGASIYHAFGGAIIYNAGEPEYIRYSITGSASYVLNHNRYELEPSFVYQLKGKEQQLVLGMLYKVIIRQGSLYTGYYDRLHVSFGGYYRIPNDAIVPTFNLTYDNFQFGVSYDVNVSPLIEASGSVGGIEFTLRFLVR
jgi:type IX secretion system PorP/SprF family membrane protein